jgi:hypothetical protein
VGNDWRRAAAGASSASRRVFVAEAGDEARSAEPAFGRGGSTMSRSCRSPPARAEDGQQAGENGRGDRTCCRGGMA